MKNTAEQRQELERRKKLIENEYLKVIGALEWLAELEKGKDNEVVAESPEHGVDDSGGTAGDSR